MCKEMYDDISLTHLFYRNNHFDFTESHMKQYLLAITDERRRAIVSMSFNWHVGYWNKVDRPQLMVLIASCKNLRSLKISLTTDYNPTIADPSKFFLQRLDYKYAFAVSPTIDSRRDLFRST